MSVRIIVGDVREQLMLLPADSFDCIVTSPPYFGLRDYGVAGQIGLEPTLAEYLDEMTAVCRELRRVLKPQGTFWLNIGDSYNSSSQNNAGKGGAKERFGLAPTEGWAGHKKLVKEMKSKDLMMVPARLAIRLQEDGWYVRSAIVWHKPNPMPESVTDRPTSSYENVFMLTKSERYFFDADAVKETALCGSKGSSFTDPRDLERHPDRGMNRPSVAKGGFGGKTADSDHPAFRAVVEMRNLRNVWTIATQPYAEAHFATFPPELAERCIKAGCPAGGHVLDPFGGAGTTGLVADRLQRNATLIELNPVYADLARTRIHGDAPLFLEAIA